jgi:F420 biosynthesis protein FbiB-like protein
MSTVIDAIKNRRSIRKYSSQAIPKEILYDIFDTARWAASPHNAQPWRFIVLTEPSLKKDLAEAMAKAWMNELTKDNVPVDLRGKLIEASIERFSHAPVIVVACITMADMIEYADEPKQKSERDLAIQSLGAAVQNMLLAAQSKSLGSCWFSAPAFCQALVRKVLRIPRDFEPQALITVGYPAENPVAPMRKPIGDIFYSGRWGNKL